MKLDDRVRNGTGLLQDFELAAEERFLDAQEILVRGHGTGATYLAGYVAEILLKSAVFLFDGARPSDLVYPRLAPAKKWAKASLPGVPLTSYHDVLFWAHVLQSSCSPSHEVWEFPVRPAPSSAVDRVHRRVSLVLRPEIFPNMTGGAGGAQPPCCRPRRGQ